VLRALPLLVLFSLTTSSAQAEDWLALYPECGFGPEARALGRMALIYPRPGLPAVVEAGERLVTRVRVPSGLTPPPGIQKDRALRGWSAELVGQSVPLGDGGEHRYRTRVVDVRPDGQSTLVYRASIEVPRWAAPGTYGLRMTAPGGADAVAGAVRIVSPGDEPRLVFLAAADVPAADHPAFLEILSTAPHDVVVAADDQLLGALSSAAPSARVPALLVFDPHLPVVLRVGSEARYFGECDDRYAPFSMQLEGLASREGLRALAFADTMSELGEWSAFRRPAPSITAAGDSLTLRADAEVACELTVRYPDDGRGVAIEGAEAAFHPAVSIPMTGEVRTIAIRLALAPGAEATLARREGSAPTAAIRTEPAAPVSGDTVRMAVEGDQLALVAWRLEEDITLVGPAIEHAYRPVGEERVSAFVISEEGVGAPLRATVTIQTREVRGCGGCGAAGGPSGADLWLIWLVLLRMGNRRRNRLRSRRR